MLYGCKIWNNMSETDLHVLEATNQFAAKKIQGLCSTTRSEAATGGIGLSTIEGYINKAKLFFLYRIMKSPSTTIHKYLFITRFSSYLNKLVAKPLGFIPDIFRILEKYGLLDCIDNYLADGTLPSEHEWKTLVKERLARNQSDIWLKGVSEKPELINYGKVHANLQPLNLWEVAKRNPLYIREILNTVNIICGNVPQALVTAVTVEGTHFKCKLCAKDLTDVSRHFLLDCPYSRRSREYMFDKIQDLFGRQTLR